MSNFTTTIYETIEVFHPEFDDGISEMELECKVELYYEPEDISVGIFGASLIAEEVEVVSICIYNGNNILTIGKDIAEQLISEDEWERILNKAMKSAEGHDQY